MQVSQLSGGPQDGAKITIGAGELPFRVHVGPKWLGDGFAAWSRDPCERFPAVYVQHGERHIFSHYQTEEER